MSDEEPVPQRWHAYPSRQRKRMGVLSVGLVGFVVYAAAIDGLPAVGAPLYGFLPLMALLNWLEIRQRTQARASSLRVTGEWRTRRIAWSDVFAINAAPEGRWPTYVQAELADGRTVRLVGVPPSDVQRLLDIRRMHRAV